MNHIKAAIKNAAARKGWEMKKILITALFMLGWAIPSQAITTTDVLFVEWFYPNTTSVYGSSNLSVGAPANFVGGAISIVVNANTLQPEIVFDFTVNGYFYIPPTGNYSGFRFTDASGMADFTDVSVHSDTNIMDLSQNSSLPDFASRVSFDANSFSINYTGYSFTSDTVVALNVTQAAAVPEPGTLLLLGSGLLSLAVLRRRTQTGLV